MEAFMILFPYINFKLEYTNFSSFLIKTPFLKYYKSAKSKFNEYFEEFLYQFWDISAVK